MEMRNLWTGLVIAVLVVAACSSSADDSESQGSVADDVDPVASAESSQATQSVGDGHSASTDDGAGTDGSLFDETIALDLEPGAPELDANVPAEPPDMPVGRPGYTRYVYARAGDEVIPALVEGPRREQTRCQSVELPCSFDDLRAIATAGDEIPDALGLDQGQLQALVAELSALEAALGAFREPDAACAAGYRPDQKQTPNMGSHFTNNELIDGIFDPGEPEILLYARRDGVEPEGALGICAGGSWVGEDVEVVGAAFFLPFRSVGADHVEGFTGQLDNWHVHYNLCRLDGRDVTVEPDDCGPGTPDGPPDQPRGDASEGWMIHAWADRGHDNQLGVFSMWNPTLWPVADPADVRNRGSLSGTTDGANVISDFTLPDVTVPEPGTLSFFNADGEAHTVTAGSPSDPGSEFDTGVIGGRDGNEITIAAPGTYSYFCQIHPSMQGTITVGDS